MLEDIHATSRLWYAAKQAAGEAPMTIVGGDLDGLDYYEVEVDGVTYWITDVGIFDPPDGQGADPRLG